MEDAKNSLSLLEKWVPLYKHIRLSATEKKAVERAGRTIAKNTLERDIPVLIAVSHGSIPTNIPESQMLNYIQGVFDMASSRMKKFPHGRNHLPLLATEFALACLKSGEKEPNKNAFNYHGPRLRNPGNDWSRY